jgi:hypothetical protein
MAYSGFARKGLTVGARLDNAPDRQDRLAQGCSGQWRLRPKPCWLRARHGREFRHHRVDEGVDVTESLFD